MNKIVVLLLVILGIYSCKSKESKILEETLAAHGSKLIYKNKISFDFRNVRYGIDKSEDFFRYVRVSQDSLGRYLEDQYSNEGFSRKIGEEIIEVPDSMAKKYSESINSVAYFFLLPEPLQDPAVNLQYKGFSTIKGEKYNKLSVTFQQEDGGKDFKDEYRYWINTKTNLIDYFAYSYDNESKGVRFRQAINRRTINGMVFSDYKNYGFEDSDFPIDSLESWYNQNKIPYFSTIENQNINLIQK